MGHVLFVVLHVVAALFGAFALLLTLPLHVIYGALAARRGGPVRPFIPGPGDIQAGAVFSTHCPDCREQVRSDARKCKHCGSDLTPKTSASQDNL